jgi:predicted ArsR family transcriptional regulator
MNRAVAALQDLTRRDILYRFYSDPSPKTAIEVAEAAGIHRSVAFDHLERLVSLGYVEAERRRGFPGKPAKLYRLAQGPPITVSHPPRQFGLLAQQLALALQEFGPAGVAAAVQAGRRLAESLPAAPGERGAELEPLEALGGGYELLPSGVIRVENCLFREACDAAGVVCHFHAAAISRLLEDTAENVEVEVLGQHGRSGCSYRVAARAPVADRRAAAV